MLADLLPERSSTFSEPFNREFRVRNVRFVSPKKLKKSPRVGPESRGPSSGPGKLTTAPHDDRLSIRDSAFAIDPDVF